MPVLRVPVHAYDIMHYTVSTKTAKYDKTSNKPLYIEQKKTIQYLEDMDLLLLNV